MRTNFFSFHLVLYRVTAKAHNSYIQFCSGFIPCFRYYENYKTCLETFRGNCSGYHIYKGELYQWKWHTYLDCPRLLGELQLTYNNIITILFINGRLSSINIYLLCNKAIWLIDTVLYVLSHNRNPILYVSKIHYQEGFSFLNIHTKDEET